jgi:hypothetical protein
MTELRLLVGSWTSNLFSLNELFYPPRSGTSGTSLLLLK